MIGNVENVKRCPGKSKYRLKIFMAETNVRSVLIFYVSSRV